MPRPSEAPASDAAVGQQGLLRRFSRGERWTHRTFGLLMGGCLITAALLYVPVLSGLIGQRDVVKTVHEVCGFALPVPLIAGYLASRDLRSDVGRLNRFRPADWRGCALGRNASCCQSASSTPVRSCMRRSCWGRCSSCWEPASC